MSDAYNLDRVAFLDDGAVAAIYGTHVVVFEADGTTRADIAPPAGMGFEETDMVFAKTTIMPDGETIAYLGAKRMALWSTKTNACARVIDSPPVAAWPKGGFVYDVMCQRGRLVGLAIHLGSSPELPHVFVWDDDFTRREIPVEKTHLAVSTDGTHAIAELDLIDLATGKTLRRIEDGHTPMAASDGAARIVHPTYWSEGDDYRQGVTIVGTGARIALTESANAIAISRDGKLAASIGLKGLSIIDLEAKKERFYKSLGDRVEGVAVSNDGKRVACGCGPRVVVLDAETGADLSSFEGSIGAATIGANEVVTVGNGKLDVWSLTGERVRSIDAGNVGKLASGDGFVATAGDRGVQRVDLDKGVTWSTGRIGTIDSIAVFGDMIAAGVEIEHERFAIVWKDGKELVRTKPQPAPVEHLAFSRDGALLASSSSSAFEHGDMYGDETVVVVTEIASGKTREEVKVPGRAWGDMMFEGDDLLVAAEGSTFRHRGKKTSKVAARLELAHGTTSLRRTKAGKWELFRDGEKVSAMTLPGQPVALHGKHVLVQSTDGTYVVVAAPV
jgi:WD40 repeat protein